MSNRWRVLVALSVWVACEAEPAPPATESKPTADAPKAAQAAPEAKAETKVAEPPEAEAEAEAKAKVEAEAKADAPPPPAEDEAAPVEDEAPPAEDEAAAAEAEVKPPEPVAVAAVTPTPRTVSWRSVASPEHAVTFEPLRRGVLGKSEGGYYDVDANAALVLRPEIEAPKGPVLGVWPDNAWFIDERIKSSDGRAEIDVRQLRLMRLRGERRWVPQMVDGTQRFEDQGHRFAVGGKGGMLVEFEEDITRVAGRAEDPDQGAYKEGVLRAFFETRSGRLYSAREADDTLYVQRDCVDQACVTASATPLPRGTQWSFEPWVPRAKHSITAVATVRDAGTDAPHLLHYGGGSWKLESLEAAPTGLWAAKDGGLWVMVNDDLLHRDPAGAWQAVALPEGATGVSVAMRRDHSELWLAATVDGKPAVFGTAAVLPTDEAPPAQP